MAAYYEVVGLFHQVSKIIVNVTEIKVLKSYFFKTLLIQKAFFVWHCVMPKFYIILKTYYVSRNGDTVMTVTLLFLKHKVQW